MVDWSSLSEGLLPGEPSLTQVDTVIILILQMTRPKLREVETHIRFYNYLSRVPAFPPDLVHTGVSTLLLSWMAS